MVRQITAAQCAPFALFHCFAGFLCCSPALKPGSCLSRLLLGSSPPGLGRTAVPCTGCQVAVVIRPVHAYVAVCNE